MKIRTFGWMQNPSDFAKLKKTVQVFDPGSEQYKELREHIVRDVIYFNDDKEHFQNKLDKKIAKFTYAELVGTSRDKKGNAGVRKGAIANGLLQVTILPQSANTKNKRYTDNWTADGFLRWAVSFNFVSYNREDDTFKITDFGHKLSQSDDRSDEELEVLREAILSYPPAMRVLSLLADSKKPLTKFAIGSKLGFIGEKGFTSYDEGLMIDWLKSLSKEERSKLKSDVEGTADKYARMIATWLEKLDFVKKYKSEYKLSNNEKISGFPTYSITAPGLHRVRQTRHLPKKYVMWEFLAIAGKKDSEQTRGYIRTRRAKIIFGLMHHHTMRGLIKFLKSEGFDIDEALLKSEIDKLVSFGLRIKVKGNSITLQDEVVGIDIPKQTFTPAEADLQSEKTKNYYRKKTSLPEQYIELLDIAFDPQRYRDFEIVTAEVFKDCYGLSAIHLGGQSRPDGLIFNKNFGIILDTKAYKKGYGKHVSQIDEMCRYIEENKLRDVIRQPNEWWSDFGKGIPKDQFYYLWVSGKFLPSFDEQLEQTNYRTKINGGGLEVSQLLLGADAVLKGKLKVDSLPKYMNNEVIKLSI